LGDLFHISVCKRHPEVTAFTACSSSSARKNRLRRFVVDAVGIDQTAVPLLLNGLLLLRFPDTKPSYGAIQWLVESTVTRKLFVHVASPDLSVIAFAQALD
jgi:hypothetical protein